MKYLSHYTETLSKSMDKHGAFFAFSKKQFEERKKQGIEYVLLSNNLFVPKQNAEKLADEMSLAIEEAVRLDVKENGASNIIRREFFNHETQISMDHSSAIDSLVTHRRLFPEDFSDEAIASEFQKCWKIAVEQDLF